MKYLYQLLAVLTLLLIATTVQADQSFRLFGGLVIEGDDYQIYLGAPIRSYGGIRHNYRHNYRHHYRAPGYRQYKRGRHDYRHPQYRHKEYRYKGDHHAGNPDRQQRHQRRPRSGYYRAQDPLRNDYRLYRHGRHYNNW